MEGFIETAPIRTWDGHLDTIYAENHKSFVDAVGAHITELEQESRDALRTLALTFLGLLGGLLAIIVVFCHIPVDYSLLKLCIIIALLGTGTSEFVHWAYSGCTCAKKYLTGIRLLSFWQQARQLAPDACIAPKAT